MDKKELDEKIYNYYLHYYRDVCCIKNPEKRATFRLKEEKNEISRMARLEKISGISLSQKNHFIVGTGTGGLAVVLKEKYNCQVSGLEPDKNALAITKEKCLTCNLPPENFKEEICENISISDNSFDFIHCFTVLEHVQDISKSINEMIRIVKPGGQIYINTPNYAYPYEGHYKIPFPTFLPKVFGHLYLFLLGKSSEFLKTINFITEKGLEKTLKGKSNISWFRIKEEPTKSKGRLGWFLNYFKFKKDVYPTQEIIITKKIPLFSILTVNYNSADFIINSLYILKKLTRNPYKVLIVDNNSSLSDYQKLKKEVDKHYNIYLEKLTHNLTGSIAHGTALNHLVQKVTTPYFSILDADAIWLKKDWDKILINRLTDKIKIIGTQSDSPNKPQDFPSIYATFFETKTFKKLRINFLPKDLNQDTGFDMQGKYLSANLKGEVLIMKNTRQFKSGPFHSLVGVGEYYLDRQFKTLFASHFGRGSSLGQAKYQKTWAKPLYRLPVIGHLFLKIKGLRERNKWFKICLQLAKQQIKGVKKI